MTDKRLSRIYQEILKHEDEFWDYIKSQQEKIERLAISLYGKPIPEKADFIPPKKATKVECRCCGNVFRSDLMVLAYRPENLKTMIEVSITHDDFPPLEPFFWCPKLGCHGAGYGFDIHPSKKKYTMKVE